MACSAGQTQVAILDCGFWILDFGSKSMTVPAAFQSKIRNPKSKIDPAVATHFSPGAA
jgi:hypothetical protein